MYFYNLGTCSHEESTTRVFYSQKKLTKENLLEITINASKKYIKECPSDFASEHINIDTLFSSIPDLFFEEQGLIPLIFEDQLFLWGWNTVGCPGFKGIDKEEDYFWKYDSEEEDIKFIDAIKEELKKILKP